MLIQPKSYKFRKSFKGGTLKGIGGVHERNSHDPSGLRKGDVGLKVCEMGRRSARQREAGRRLRRNKLNRAGKVWRMVFTDVPVSKKPREVRMGKGKGNVEYWACHARPGKMRYEVGEVDQERAMAALRKVQHKRPVRCRIVRRTPQRSS